MNLIRQEKALLAHFIMQEREEQERILHNAKTVDWCKTSAALEKAYEMFLTNFN